MLYNHIMMTLVLTSFGRCRILASKKKNVLKNIERCHLKPITRWEVDFGKMRLGWISQKTLDGLFL